jgi:type VI secretion system secreted protein VgrG
VGERNENSSCFIRVSQLWAGSGFGGIHLPRIGQEVIVDFLEGDPDRPVITGRLYNADNRPPYKLPDNQTQSGIKSRSSKQGTPSNFNEIRFEDKKGKEDLFLHAERSQTTVVKGSQSISVGGSQSTTVRHDRSVAVEGKDDENYQDSRVIQVATTDQLTVGGEHTATYVSGRSLEIGSYQFLHVGGNSTTNVDNYYTLNVGDGYETLQGDNQMKLEGSLAKIKNKESKLELQGGKATLDGKAETTVSSGGASYITIKPSTIDAISDDITVDGKKVVIVGASSVEISVGASKVSISSGGIEVKGPMIKLN